MRGTVQERFWAKVDRRSPDECWAWLASRCSDGYGTFRVGERIAGAHRVAYEMLVGPIPDGLELDHLCSLRECVNPAHLEPVTHAENVARGRATRPTHCSKGHERTPENVLIQANDGHRRCRVCQREYNAAYRAARK